MHSPAAKYLKVFFSADTTTEVGLLHSLKNLVKL